MYYKTGGKAFKVKSIRGIFGLITKFTAELKNKLKKLIN